MSLDQRYYGLKYLLTGILTATIVFSLSLTAAVADELILDESLTGFHDVGDFGVASCILPIEPEAGGLLNENGEISTGKLVKYFKSKGITSVNELIFCVDVDPSVKRTDYSLESIVLSIADIDEYTLGENSLKLPAYEASSMKAEAQLAIKLDFDFMERFNENSTERIKIDITGADKSSFKIGSYRRQPPVFLTPQDFCF